MATLCLDQFFLFFFRLPLHLLLARRACALDLRRLAGHLLSLKLFFLLFLHRLPLDIGLRHAKDGVGHTVGLLLVAVAGLVDRQLGLDGAGME